MKTLNSKEGYNIYSNKYYEFYPYLDSFDRDQFILTIKNLISQKNPNILDLGIGDGRLTKQLKKLSENIFGVDISFSMLKKTKKKTNLIVNADSKYIPFKENCFDLILSSFLIVHIDNPYYLLLDISKILKINGFYIFNIISQKSPPVLSYNNKKFRIKSYYHCNKKINNILNKTNFNYDFEEIIIKGKKVSTIYICKKI